MTRCLRVSAWIVAFAGFVLGEAHAADFIVTNTRGDNGNGSLSRAIQNANNTAAADRIVFQIPTTDGGFVNVGGRRFFSIRLTQALPQITSPLVIDATTQTAFTGNTNGGQFGTGGTVGAGLGVLPLGLVDAPEIEISDGANLSIGIDIAANDCTVRGLAIYGFGNAANADNAADIRVGASALRTLIERNMVGSTAASWSDPAGNRGVGDAIRVIGGDSGTIRNNLIGFTNGKGVELNTNSNSWTITGNEIRRNGITVSNLDGIDVENGSNLAQIVGNLIVQADGCGIDTFQSTGSNTISSNTIEGNGIGANDGGLETPGIRLYGMGTTVLRNLIRNNQGAGVLVTVNSRQNTLSENAISGNGAATGGSANEIGIDLLSSTDNERLGTAPYVSPNDNGDADAGGNDRLNFPVLESATLSGTTVTLTGFSRPGAKIELFVVAADPSGFGEGQQFLIAATEGSGLDLDTTSGTYTSPYGGLNVGTDTTSRFRFALAIGAGAPVGSRLTATATLSQNTSEFSNNIVVTIPPPNVALVKSVAPTGARPPGTLLTYSVAFSNTGASAANTLVLVDAVPANTNFSVGSANAALGSTGLTVVISYSSDNGTSWGYTPVSGGGGAPPGFDARVTNVRWTFTGNLSATAPANAGSVSFVARIR